MISVQDYKPITLADRELFQKHYSKYPVSHSENLFTSLISWTHYLPPFFLMREGELLLMHIRDGKPQFRTPIGERNESVLEEVLELAKKEGGPRPVIAIDESIQEQIERLRPNTKITEDRDFFDYVYLASDLAELKGKHYVSNRNHLKRFNKKYSYSVECICETNTEEIDCFLHEWCLWQDCESMPMLEAERKAIMYCMEHFFELDLSGIVLRIDGVVKALSVYEQMNNDTAVIHFEKGLPDIEGIYQAINNEAAKILSKDYKFINRESDLGIPGLRTAKMRLNPHHMEKLYYINKEDLL